jgi:ATPase subunit of ABC transporter with duplicated ATPase domains
VLRADETPLQHMVRWPDVGPAAREQDLRDFLGSFRFTGEMVKQRVGTLSGGEKARLVLCMIVWQRPNLLLLDEPTNHLDLPPGGAVDRPQRVRRHGAAGQPRPCAAARGLRRVLAGGRWSTARP